MAVMADAVRAAVGSSVFPGWGAVCLAAVRLGWPTELSVVWFCKCVV